MQRTTGYVLGSWIGLWLLLCGSAAAEETPAYSAELVFPLHAQHNHAPGIVECPNGDLLVSWYRGSGERTADDVAVLRARKPKGRRNGASRSCWPIRQAFRTATRA